MLTATKWCIIYMLPSWSKETQVCSGSVPSRPECKYCKNTSKVSGSTSTMHISEEWPSCHCPKAFWKYSKRSNTEKRQERFASPSWKVNVTNRCEALETKLGAIHALMSNPEAGLLRVLATFEGSRDLAERIIVIVLLAHRTACGWMFTDSIYGWVFSVLIAHKTHKFSLRDPCRVDQPHGTSGLLPLTRCMLCEHNLFVSQTVDLAKAVEEQVSGVPLLHADNRWQQRNLVCVEGRTMVLGSSLPGWLPPRPPNPTLKFSW